MKRSIVARWMLSASDKTLGSAANIVDIFITVCETSESKSNKSDDTRYKRNQSADEREEWDQQSARMQKDNNNNNKQFIKKKDRTTWMPTHIWHCRFSHTGVSVHHAHDTSPPLLWIPGIN